VLTAAAEAGEPEAIDAAVEARGQALTRLIDELATHGAPNDAAQRHELMAELADQAREATAALSRLAERSRAELESQSAGGRAVRGYADGDAPPKAALDREG
jgi:hypothetical protein